ncbi:MAG TPA: Fe2+-dependent dioxygenase [Caulobacteraceae bacterium]|nr:Fe2+-dependent dioxygenase [Caulobacteraceae bacterium]
MLTYAHAVLSAAELARGRAVLAAATWEDGRATAGPQSALAKRNLQLPEGSAAGVELGQLVLDALRRHSGFIAAALPLRVFPPLFNRYDAGMGFDAHIDNAIRFATNGARYRTDIACTLFLSDPADYDGGELVIEGAFGEQRVKAPAGDAVVYPASSVHRIEPVTRGSRLAAFFWVQSMVRDDGRRALLHGLDRDIATARAELGDAHRAVVGLTGAYHNLIRMWAEA